MQRPTNSTQDIASVTLTIGEGLFSGLKDILSNVVHSVDNCLHSVGVRPGNPIDQFLAEPGRAELNPVGQESTVGREFERKGAEQGDERVKKEA